METVLNQGSKSPARNRKSKLITAMAANFEKKNSESGKRDLLSNNIDSCFLIVLSFTENCCWVGFSFIILE